MLKTLKPSSTDNSKTKEYQKNIFTFVLCNKGTEQINLKRNLEFESSVAPLPGEMQPQENTLRTSYMLIPTTQNNCNGIRTHNHLGCKRTLNHLAELNGWLNDKVIDG